MQNFIIKSEPQMVPNFSIVPENGQLENPINLTQQGIEISETVKLPQEIWTGRVSLDVQKYQNKPTDAGRINSSIANGATDIIDEHQLIEAITSGQTWNPTIFCGGKRDGEHFVEMHALVADFDDGFEHLHEIIQRAAEHSLEFSFIHESFNHTPEHPKYRGVFLLDETIEDFQEAKFYCEWIKDVFKGMVDKGAAEPTRFYYGGRKESLVFHNKGQTLSLNSLKEKAADFKKRTEETKKTPKKKPAKSLQESPKKENTKTDTVKIGANFEENDIIYDAGIDENGLLIVNYVEGHQFIEFDSDDFVDILSPENLVRVLEIKTALEVLDIEICTDYNPWREISMALHHEGTTNDDLNFTDAMRGLFHAYSQKVPEKYEEDVADYKWESFSNRDDDSDNITIKTLFHYAHEKVSNVTNIIKLAREIYPLVDSFYKLQELEKQKQQLTSALKTGDSLQYMEQMPMRQRVSHYMENHMAPDLRYNLHTREFEYKGDVLDIHDFHLHLVVTFNKEVGENIFRKAYEKYANKYAYHPFQEYIESLVDNNFQPSDEEYNQAIEYLNKVAREYLHTNDEFEHLIFRKWILGIVSRVLEPGCKFDGVLMLKGAQGLGKTTFFESIAGLDYYRSHLGEINRDARAKMHRAIVIELAEIAATFGKVKNEALKNFITERVDTFRLPYGCSDMDYPRRFVFGGSTNDDEFLTDSTGSRRYWVIEINEMIDTAAIRKHRDEILRAAYIMKLYGEKPFFNADEFAINEERNTRHKQVTLLEEAVAAIVQSRMQYHENHRMGTPEVPFLSTDIVAKLKEEYPSLKPTTQVLNAALKNMGFVQEHKRFNSKVGRWWQPTEEYYVKYGDEVETPAGTN